MHNKRKVRTMSFPLVIAVVLSLLSIQSSSTSPNSPPTDTILHSQTFPIVNPHPTANTCFDHSADSLVQPPSRSHSEQQEGKNAALTLGVSPSAPPSHLSTDPDGFKALPGYSGPFYNVAQLDGNVLIVMDTLYTWPGEAWLATGLVRNQTCADLRIHSITANLFDANGESLDRVTATLPLRTLRPGEPAPFVIGSPTPTRDVERVEWQVDSAPSKTGSRSIELEVFEAKSVLGGQRYSLFGSIRNTGSVTTSRTRVVAAWFNAEDKIVFVAFPKIRRISDPTQVTGAIDLEPGAIEDFLFVTEDPALVMLLDAASVALWGDSE